MSKKKKKKKEPLRRELDAYRKEGMLLLLCEEMSTPGQIVRAYRVAEGGTYMRDYVLNERGEVETLRFDFVEYEN